VLAIVGSNPLWAVTVLLCASLGTISAPSFPVFILSNSDFDFSGSHFEVVSGNAQATCDKWAGGEYQYGGSGCLFVGTGSGYYGMSNYWYTDEGQLDGGSYATIKFECDYGEYGSGIAGSFIRAYLFVYKYQNPGWTCVASGSIREDDHWDSPSHHYITAYHDFDSSRYKFRFLARVEFSQAYVNNWITNLEVNNGTVRHSDWLKVFD